MGSKPKYRPQNLAAKLLQIRKALGLSQSQMLQRLGVEHSLSAARISEYETGIREPSFWVLLAYGRVARVHLETLLDDEATLPQKLPGNFNFARYKQKPGSPQREEET
ncbi:MAG TPA: helix-turn-helix transcriptional regulator [Pyrinomonadaceae bacterium]